MSGIFIDDPDVRNSQRLRIVHHHARRFLFAVSLDNCGAVGSRRFFRPKQAEFPVTHQTAWDLDLSDEPVRGRCAAGRASIDALRLTNNSVNIEDSHEISFIGETLAAFARRFPPKGRPPRPLSGRAAKSSPQTNILAATCGIFWRKRQDREKSSQ